MDPIHQLHSGIQRWMWKQGWTGLREIQAQAVKPILAADCDLVISASTAAGKTEAAFLPACSAIADQNVTGFGILYLSPLKSLINDQHRRLNELCDYLDFPVNPWHGDVSQSVKQRSRKHPKGILLITPESLEAMLMGHGAWLQQALAPLRYFIIDEFHAFIGTERGCQLQSLMHRVEFLLKRKVPRIALSATLGDMERVMAALRPGGSLPCRRIESASTSHHMQLQLRGYLHALPEEELDLPPPTVNEAIADDLYRLLRGQSHLIFANSRQRTEGYAAALSDRCQAANVPNEFFPHHGSLAKEVREDLEARLQAGRYPTSAVCTMTLELGIDIGNVDSVAQVSAPHAVASLRQRLGRSGRRGGPAILRLFITENEINRDSHLNDRLRLELFQTIAIVELLLQRCYEPPNVEEYHFSTLIQQTLSLIAQYGGVRAEQAWRLLCRQGVFHKVTQNHFAQILRQLAKFDLITQTHDGQLVLGVKGERLVGHYNFYAAFNAQEEYRLEHGGKTLGTLPVDGPLAVGEQIIFSGNRWEIANIDTENRVISLTHAQGGTPPNFSGNSMFIHDGVRQKMLQIYRDGNCPAYLDNCAKALFAEGLDHFRRYQLDDTPFVQMGGQLYALPWLGGRVLNTLCMLWQLQGLKVGGFGGVIEVENCRVKPLLEICELLLKETPPEAAQLAEYIADRNSEKYDYLLPKSLSCLNYGARAFDVAGAFRWMEQAVADQR